MNRPAPPSREALARVLLLFRQHSGQTLYRSELSALTGLTDPRLRECIAELVTQGAPIVAESEIPDVEKDRPGRPRTGYRLTNDAAEIRATIRALSSRADRLRARIAGLERALPHNPAARLTGEALMDIASLAPREEWGP